MHKHKLSACLQANYNHFSCEFKSTLPTIFNNACVGVIIKSDIVLHFAGILTTLQVKC